MFNCWFWNFVTSFKIFLSVLFEFILISLSILQKRKSKKKKRKRVSDGSFTNNFLSFIFFFLMCIKSIQLFLHEKTRMRVKHCQNVLLYFILYNDFLWCILCYNDSSFNQQFLWPCLIILIQYVHLDNLEKSWKFTISEEKFRKFEISEKKIREVLSI